MKISAILKGSICALGLVGVGNILTAPASAQQAAARAAVSITNPSSFTQSVSGEVLLPDGLYFGGTPATGTAATPGFIGDTPEVVDDPATTDTDESAPAIDVDGNGNFDDPAVEAVEASVDYDPGSTLIVTPDIAFDDANVSAQIDGLSFYAGEVASVSELAGGGATISDVVAAILANTNITVLGGGNFIEGPNAVSIDDAAAIIKAAAGVDGLE